MTTDILNKQTNTHTHIRRFSFLKRADSGVINKMAVHFVVSCCAVYTNMSTFRCALMSRLGEAIPLQAWTVP
jgi:hypothetical protein